MASCMEVDEEATGENASWSFWEDFKKKLGDDMPPEHLREVKQLLRSKVQIRIETDLPSDVLDCLESQYSEGQALVIMKHVLGAMNYHHQSSEIGSYVALIEEYELKIKDLLISEHFVGRTRDLKEILQMLSSDSDISGYWIYAMGGMGKTTLVNEICLRVCTRSNTRLIKLNLSTFDNFIDMLKNLLHELNHYSSDTLETDLIGDTFECVSNLEHDTLIVFDSIEGVYDKHPDKVEAFVKNLINQTKQSNPKIRLIFTSRLPFNPMIQTEMRSLSLQPLSTTDAEKMLCLLLKPVQINAKEKEEIIRNCGRVPLTIRLIANQIRICYEYGTIENIGALITKSQPGIQESVKFAFEHLNERRQNEIAMLMIFETSCFDIKDAASVLDESCAETLLILLDHIKSQLLEEHQMNYNSEEADRNSRFGYRFHQDVFTSLKCFTTNEKHLHFQRLAKMHLTQNTLQQLDHECEHFEKYYAKAFLFVTKSNTRLRILFSTISDSSLNLPLSDKQLKYIGKIPSILYSHSSKYDILLRVANSYKLNGRSELYCYWYLEIVNNFLELKDFTKARESLHKVEACIGIRDLQPDKGANAVLIFEYYFIKGRLLRCEKEYDSALRAETEALNTLKSWAENDVSRQAAVYNAIGNIQHDLKEYDESYMNHKMAVDIMEEYVKEEWTPNMSVYMFNLGTISYAKAIQIGAKREDAFKEKLREALTYYNISIKSDVKLKLDNLNGYSDKLKIRARAFLELCEYDNAIADVEKSIAMKERLLQDGPKQDLILGYYQMAEVYKKRANEHYKSGASVLREKDINTCYTWMNKAAQVIEEAGESGLSPDNAISSYFAKDYEAVAKVLGDKRETHVIQFCTDFLHGSYFKSNSESSSSSDGEPPTGSDSSSWNEASDHPDPLLRRDSGIEGSFSSTEPRSSFNHRNYSYTSCDREMSNNDDEEVFMDENHAGSGRKRTLSD